MTYYIRTFMSNRIPFLKNIDRMYFYDRAMMPSKKKKTTKKHCECMCGASDGLAMSSGTVF